MVSTVKKVDLYFRDRKHAQIADLQIQYQLKSEWSTLTDVITPNLAICGANDNQTMKKESKSVKTDAYIINGVEVTKNSWPWIVRIKMIDQA